MNDSGIVKEASEVLVQYETDYAIKTGMCATEEEFLELCENNKVAAMFDLIQKILVMQTSYYIMRRLPEIDRSLVDIYDGIITLLKSCYQDRFGKQFHDVNADVDF